MKIFCVIESYCKRVGRNRADPPPPPVATISSTSPRGTRHLWFVTQSVTQNRKPFIFNALRTANSGFHIRCGCHRTHSDQLARRTTHPARTRPHCQNIPRHQTHLAGGRSHCTTIATGGLHHI
jgi:hypothetical protein